VEQFPFFAGDKGKPYPIHDFREPGLTSRETAERAAGAIEDAREFLRRLDAWNKGVQDRAKYAAAVTEEWKTSFRQLAREAQQALARARGQQTLGKAPPVPPVLPLASRGPLVPPRGQRRLF